MRMYVTYGYGDWQAERYGWTEVPLQAQRMSE